MGGSQAQDLAQLIVPANQLGNRLRQICWRQRRCGQRRRHSCASALVWARRQNAGFAGELVAAPGDGADQIPLCAKGSAQCRDLGLQAVFLDDAVWPHPRHQRVLGDNPAARLDQRHQDVEGAPAELDRPAVGEQLAAVRRYPETSEREARRCFGSAFHRSTL
jgi:hypothetical protein